MKEQSELELELARAYIKIQQYTKRFSPLEGLDRGTIFPELFMPYERKGKDPVKREPQRERERERELNQSASWRSFGRGGRNG